MTLTSEQSAYLNSLQGLPWVRGAEGPKAYDCWGLFRHLSKQLFDRNVPSITDPPLRVEELQPFVAAHEANLQWRVVDRPVHGGMVQMAHNMHPFHVGMYLDDADGGGIFHCAVRIGVTFDPMIRLQAAGWRRFVYHDWNSHA